MKLFLTIKKIHWPHKYNTIFLYPNYLSQRYWIFFFILFRVWIFCLSKENAKNRNRLFVSPWFDFTHVELGRIFQFPHALSVLLIAKNDERARESVVRAEIVVLIRDNRKWSLQSTFRFPKRKFKRFVSTNRHFKRHKYYAHQHSTKQKLYIYRT